MSKKFLLLAWVAVALISGACDRVTLKRSRPTETPRPSASEAANLPSSNDTPTARPQNPLNTLSPGDNPGALLTGSGVVTRTLLTYNDLMEGLSTAPVDDSAFALPAGAAMPSYLFEGRLELSGEADNGGFQKIRDDYGYSADSGRLHLPEFNFEFVQDGSHFIPVTRGLSISGHPYWNYSIGPGRIWRENSDNGYDRASFPFALVMRNQNCTHNGVMTFLFNGKSVSNVRYQITQETCLYFKFNMWGQLSATYTPEIISNADALKTNYASELANRLPTKPISALAVDFPGSGFNASNLTRGISPAHMTTYGLVINDTNYVSGCETRYGQYAYCESMRLPSYSTAKSAFASLALMRLGQKYGIGVYDLLIKDYVPEYASSPGNWMDVTFKNTIDMATGNYRLPGIDADEDSSYMDAFFNSETYSDKMAAAFNFPSTKAPGQLWVYHTSDTFILTRAMNNYLVQQEGNSADIFNMVRDEIYTPLKLSAGAMSTLRTDNNSNGAPFGGYGLFWTQDDIAKIALLLNNQNGAIDGKQVLQPDMLADAMQKDADDRGLDTTGTPVFKYNNGFWAMQFTPAYGYSCSFWVVFMSGYGGISVVMMPNGATYYYFSDNGEFSWDVVEPNKLKPMCP